MTSPDLARRPGFPAWPMLPPPVQPPAREHRARDHPGAVRGAARGATGRRVGHSQDDLIARVSRLESVEDAIAFLQQLTPADREQLARSDTPLAAFADVTTPEEAIARFESLDDQRKMQLLAMFMRVEDSQGGR